MRRYFMFILIILLAFPIFIKAGMEHEPYSYFYKKDEQGNIISDAEFKLRSLDGSVVYNVVYDSTYHAYKYQYEITDSFENAMKLIPSDKMDILNSLTKMEDFEPYFSLAEGRSTLNGFKDAQYICNPTGAGDGITKNNSPIKRLVHSTIYSSCHAEIPIIMILEETKTPKGLEKETAVTTAVVIVDFYFDSDTYEVNNKEVTVYTYDNMSYTVDGNTFNYEQLYKYDENLDYTNVANAYETFLTYGRDMNYDETICALKSAPTVKKQSTMDNYSIRKLDSNGTLEFNEKDCAKILVDKAGTSNLSISSYVNSEEEIDIEETSTVQIKVHLKNDGKAPSYDNVIVSKVPAGVEYVSGSATDNGVYSEEDKTVTWNFAYLDAKDGYMFAYDVVVPTGSKSSVYVTSSSVSAEDTNTPIESNEARVLTPGAGNSNNEIVNPKTGDTRTIVSLIILTISVGFLSYFFTKKSMTL